MSYLNIIMICQQHSHRPVIRVTGFAPLITDGLGKI